MRPSWADSVWPIKVIAPGLFFEGFLIDSPDIFPLVIHGLLWDFPNSQAMQGGGGYELVELHGYYSRLEISKEVFEEETVWNLVPNQEVPLVPY